MRTWSCLSLATLLAACSGRGDSSLDSVGQGSASAGATAGDSAGGGGGGSAGSGGMSGGDSAPNDGALRFDLADSNMGGGDGSEDRACDKIDFLFVVDNSGSMAEEQAALAASFGGFMDTVKTSTGSNDFQVMVIDSDSWCDPDTKATYKGDCKNPVGRNCDEMLGAGLLKKGDGTECGVKGVNRFMNAAQEDINTVFQCLGQVGVNGSGDERMTEAMVQAITVHNAAGACNAGFVRNDALLVIVLLTDENDDHEAETGQYCPGLAPLAGSAGTPQTWFDEVVRVKGAESNVVVLSIVGPDNPPCPGNAGCQALPNGAQTATTILDFTRRFTNGKIAPICSQNYVQFFADSVATVTEACKSYVPPR